MTDADLEGLVSRVKSLEESLREAWQLLYRVERKLLTSGMLLTMDDISPDRDSQLEVVTGVSNLLRELSKDFKCQLEELETAQARCCPMMPGPGPNG
jgi:hypothetical protein